MVISISKRKQPVDGSFGKKGFIFFRVKNNGVFVQDFKTRMEAQRFAKRLRRR